MLLSTLVDDLQCFVIGSGDLNVNGIRFADEAGEDDIAIAYTNQELQSTKASVVLVPMGVYDTKKILIISVDIYLLSIQIAKRMVQQGILRDYERRSAKSKVVNGVRYGIDVKIGENTYIDTFTSIGDYVSVGNGCHIGANVSIGSGVVIGDNVIINDGVRLGCKATYNYNSGGIVEKFFGIGRVVIGDNTEIGCNSVIERGSFSDTVIGSNTVISSLVGIGHDCKIGDNVIVMGQAGVSGGSVIRDNTVLHAQVGVAGGITIGKNCIIQGQSGVWKSIKDNSNISGRFGRSHIEEMRIRAGLEALLKRR